MSPAYRTAIHLSNDFGMHRSEIVNPCICWLFKWRRGEGFPYAPSGGKEVIQKGRASLRLRQVYLAWRGDGAIGKRSRWCVLLAVTASGQLSGWAGAWQRLWFYRPLDQSNVAPSHRFQRCFRHSTIASSCSSVRSLSELLCWTLCSRGTSSAKSSSTGPAVFGAHVQSLSDRGAESRAGPQ